MIRSIIIDDEPHGRSSLKNALAKYCPAVEIISECESAEQGIDAIRLSQPDLVFLDIQMPTLSGFDLLQQLAPISFEIIFVTSYDQYAVKAFKFSAIDYLLKPVNPAELRQAIDKVENKSSTISIKNRFESFLNNLPSKTDRIERLAVPTTDGINFFAIDDIIYCQAEGNYTTLNLTNKKREVVARTLKDFDNLLHTSGFCRVHNSTLINLKHVTRYIKGEGGYVILTDGYHVDISRRKKEEFLSMLNKI